MEIKRLVNAIVAGVGYIQPDGSFTATGEGLSKQLMPGDEVAFMDADTREMVDLSFRGLALMLILQKEKVA